MSERGKIVAVQVEEPELDAQYPCEHLGIGMKLCA